MAYQNARHKAAADLGAVPAGTVLTAEFERLLGGMSTCGAGPSSTRSTGGRRLPPR